MSNLWKGDFEGPSSKWTRIHALVTFRSGKCSTRPNVWADIRSTLLDSQDDKASYHGDLDATQNSESHGSDERIWVGQILLKGID